MHKELNRYLRKRKSRTAETILALLASYLEENQEEPIKFLYSFWEDQANAITYKELRECILAGYLTSKIISDWQQDYSKLVASRFPSVWQKAMSKASENLSTVKKKTITINLTKPHVQSWIKEHSAKLITECTKAQTDAIRTLLLEWESGKYTADELAHVIRPCIGLTKPQAAANTRYYEHVRDTMRKEHPRMKPEVIERKAREQQLKYRARQLRYRAETIAQTEIAMAYNYAQEESVRQAIEAGLLPAMRRQWITSGDDNVCSDCKSLDGEEVGMDENFAYKKKTRLGTIYMAKQLPPLHPRCGCQIEYVEDETAADFFMDIPRMESSITESDSFREYSDEEINSIARQTEVMASKHITTPSKWSGKMVIGEGVKDDSGRIVQYGKLWNCDIVTKHETAPGIILHEQIHARSASYHDRRLYSEYQNIEEASVQFMVQEISKIEGIEIINSCYDEKVDILREFGKRIGYRSDYDFAKELIEIDMPERIDWLSEQLYAIMRLDSTATLEDYIKVSELLNMLH